MGTKSASVVRKSTTGGTGRRPGALLDGVNVREPHEGLPQGLAVAANEGRAVGDAFGREAPQNDACR